MALKNSLRRLKLPNKVKKGEVITVKTMAEHEMEPGVRRDPKTGVIYPRFIIDLVIVRYNGIEVFKARWFSGISQNPYMSFKFKPESSGVLEIEWIDDYQQSTFKRAELKVINEDGELVLPLQV